VDGETRVAIREGSDIITARQQGRALAAQVGFSSADQTLIATAISEVARNILRYAQRGEILVRLVQNGKRGIVIIAHDEGPGIPDITLALHDGHHDKMETLRGACSLIDWAVATRALAGQRVCGDQSLVHPFSGGVLVAVVDGLGHGEEAVTAATLAVAMLRVHADEAVVPVLQRCHDHLKETRGVVMSVASFRAQTGALTWAGVGDVDGVVLGAPASGQPRRESVPLRGGVLGYHLPPLRAVTVTVRPGDLLILATDGVRSSFLQAPQLHDPVLRQSADGPQELAKELVRQYAKDTDDALVLVARYRGDPP
jgi:anti-sigma regulatory factor (Ser/Thr protein kinase)